MKKLLLLLLFILFSGFVGVSAEDTSTESPIEVYEGEFITSEGTYHRIEWNDEEQKWHGVSYIEDIYIEVTEGTGISTIDYNNIYIDFSRDMKSLDRIFFAYTTQNTCGGIVIGGLCIGSIIYGERLDAEITNGTDSWWDEFWQVDEIRRTDKIIEGVQYDFVIGLETPTPLSILKVVKWEFVLTDAEVDQLKLDINDQYNYEVNEIAEDTELSYDEKILALEKLNEEYQNIPEVTYNYQFAESCPVGSSECIEIMPDDFALGSDEIPEYVDIIDLIITKLNEFIDSYGWLLLGSTSLLGLLVSIAKSLAVEGISGVLTGTVEFITVVLNGIRRLFIWLIWIPSKYIWKYVIIGLWNVMKWIFKNTIGAVFLST